MSGEGHIADMITRMKNNQALKQQRKLRQQKLNELFRENHHPNQNEPIHDVKISAEKLSKLKFKIRKSLNRDNRLGLIYSLIFTTLAIAGIVVIAIWIFVDL